MELKKTNKNKAEGEEEKKKKQKQSMIHITHIHYYIKLSGNYNLAIVQEMKTNITLQITIILII